MASDPRLTDSRRAAAIVSRARLFATLFAVLTALWIALDALVLDGWTLAAMAAARTLAAAAFAVIAASCRLPAPTLAEARARLGALLLVPALFFLVAVAVLPHSLPGEAGRAIVATYAFFPFLLAAGIGAFPLAIGEVVGAAGGLVLAEALALSQGAIAPSLGGFEMLWLLVLIAAASGFAASSQAKLLGAFIEEAIRDPLTGCLRREAGAEVLALQFGLAVRHGAPLALLFADIDRFKRVNDAFGHEAGDRVLAATAQAFRDIARETDSVIRWGGEEFVVLLPHADAAEAAALVERLGRRGLGLLPDGAAVTVSIGIAQYPRDAVGDGHELVALADQRMYLAKEAGRNRVVAGAGAQARLVVAPRAEHAAP
jgi:diguanylate cyclase (GGDEF)-like protein